MRIDVIIVITILFTVVMTNCSSDQGLKQSNDHVNVSQSDDVELDEGVDEEGEENEVEIEISMIPEMVTNALGLQYPGAEILEVDQITQVNGMITYDIEIKYHGEVIEPMYDAFGGFLGLDSDE